MPNTYSRLPIVECPHCEAEFQLDDYYDLTAGDTFECGVCQKTIHVLSVDTVMEARLGIHSKA